MNRSIDRFPDYLCVWINGAGAELTVVIRFIKLRRRCIVVGRGVLTIVIVSVSCVYMWLHSLIRLSFSKKERP